MPLILERFRLMILQRHRSTLVPGLAIVVLLVGFAAVMITQASAASALLSQGKPITASSVASEDTPASSAVDGDAGTRWSSQPGDPQWLQVDLGAPAAIDRVVLTWADAHARAFQIQVSEDSSTWTRIYHTDRGPGGTQKLIVIASGRYLRMLGTASATAQGYSLGELQIFGTGGDPAQGCERANAAEGKPVAASSVERRGLRPLAAVDGDPRTRWSSQFADGQWLQVDLGSAVSICGVVLSWEDAYAKAFEIQVSADGSTWNTIYRTNDGTGGTQTLAVTGNGRHVRMFGTERATPYGFSLWEFEVRAGQGPPAPRPSASSPPADRPSPEVADSPDESSVQAQARPDNQASGPDPASFWGDTSDIPAASNVLTFKILNRTNGKYSDGEVFWSFNGQAHSIAEQPYGDMPANSAGRMYFFLESPNNPYADFIEFTIEPDAFNGNTTRVDGFGLKLAMRLHAHDGFDASVGEDFATFQEDRAATFQRFIDEVPAEFDVLAQAEAPYRILAPGRHSSFQPGGTNANYFGGQSTTDIFGCAGPFANDPSGCAARNRNSQGSDPSQFYRTGPANFYAKFWHDHAINGLAYGFPYDDFAEQSSYISHGDPQYLLVAVGW